MDCSLLYHQRLKSPLQRFEEKYIPVTESGCWIWMSGTKYGTFYINGKVQSAHKAAWLMFRGTVPKGMFVCHKCDIPHCVNPNHLFLGTPQENMDDKKNKGRENYLRGSAIKNSKITEIQAFIIKCRDNESSVAVAKDYEITPANVRAIWKGKSWTHIIVDFL